MKTNTKKLAVAALFAALSVVGSLFSFPVFGAKCAPVQHLVNILCAILLGPWWGVVTAFVASLIRNMLALGTVLAFPGSMCGALLAGLLGKYGYIANQTQNAIVLSIMKHAFTTIPGVLWIVTAVVLFFYRLNKKRYNEIVEELKNGKKS